MCKLARAFAAAAAVIVTAPAGAAITTTNYSVSGGALTGTFALDFNDATSTYSLSALDLTLGAQFDTSNTGLVQEIPGNPVWTVGGTINGTTSVNPVGGVDDFLFFFNPATDPSNPPLTYSVEGVSGALNSSLLVDRTNVSGTTSDYAVTSNALNGTFSLDFDGGSSTYSLTTLDLVLGQTFDLSNTGIVQEVPGNPLWTIGGTLNGLTFVQNGTNDFLFFFNPELTTANAGLLFSIGGLANPLSTQVTISQVQGPGTPGVPEPATWAMMLLGFGAVGLAVRRRRKVAALA